MTKQFEPFVHANDSLADPTELKAMLAERGYLFLQGLIPPGTIGELRYDMRQVLLENGYVVEDPQCELKWSGKIPEGDEMTSGGRVGRFLSALPSLQGVIYSEELRRVLQDLFGGEIRSWVENVDRLRAQFQSDMSSTSGGQWYSYTTPAHQDGYHFDVPFLTAWIPLMDIDLKTGGLALLKGSHQEGLQQHWWQGRRYLGIAESTQHAQAMAAQGGTVVAGAVEPHDRPKTWLRSNYTAGDVLIFHPHMVHKGVGNCSQQLRLSGDFRYQRAGTRSVWQASSRLFETHEYLTEARQCLEQLKIHPALADRAWELMRQEGPPDTVDVQTQASRFAARVLNQASDVEAD